MPQNPSDMFTGPYGPNDPAANLAHSAVTKAGQTDSKSSLTPEAEASINRVNKKIDETVVNAIKGKAPTPPRPKPPKPPSDYALAREARKK